MIIKEIIQLGNPVIRNRSKNVSNKDIKSRKIKIIVKNLVDSMHYYDLVGISAPQINHNLRIFITEIRNTKNRDIKELDNLKIFINPEILFYSKEKISGYEGCGSVSNSNLFGLVKRPKSVIIKAQDVDGEWFQFKAQGLLSRVIQHEYDHLNGIIFIDRVTDIKSYMSGSEYRKKNNKTN